jgi:signal transduction histidine kinase
LEAGHFASRNEDDTAAAPSAYADALAEYARTHSEEALYRASLLSQAFVKAGTGPEEIIAIHGEAFEQLCEGCSDRDKVRLSGDALQFLLEIMIAYGVQHAEYTEMIATDAERRATEAQRQAAQAREAEERKSELMALVAHELRTPITAALGSVQLARRSLSKGNVERIPRLLDSTEETLHRLSRLTADLVEASRGDTPSVEQTPQELVVLVSQACTWAAAIAQEKGVELFRESEAWSARVRGDADALLTIFGNILANAVRYTPAGGRVTVRYWTEADHAIVEVVDTGIGMSDDDQERIFEQFFRATEARQIEQKGLGLGLFLVQRLVHAHAGRIEVNSAPGRGSTFRVLLPLMTAETTIRTQEDR